MSSQTTNESQTADAHTDDHGHHGTIDPLAEASTKDCSRRRFNVAATVGGATALTANGFGYMPNYREDHHGESEHDGEPYKASEHELNELKHAVEEFGQKHPEKLKRMQEAVDHGHDHGPDAYDVVGCGIFGHGLSDIVRHGHVTAAPYQELAMLWILKFLNGNDDTRAHLMQELMVNSALIGTIIGLVTIGDTAVVDMLHFQKNIDKKLNSWSTKRHDLIATKGTIASEGLSRFHESLVEKCQKGIGSGKKFNDCVSEARAEFQYGDSSNKKDIDRVIQYYLNKEVRPMHQVALREKDGETSKENCKMQSYIDRGETVMTRMMARFDNKATVKETYNLAAGSMVFSSATSPVWTTIAPAGVADKAGIMKQLRGDTPPEYKSLKENKWTDMPPFHIRMNAVLEDHIANLSGLGGVGDPPFLAMFMKYGLKGFFTQWAVSIPSTFMNAEFSFAQVLAEHFPYLNQKEIHEMATMQMAELAPEWLGMTVSNVINLIMSIIEFGYAGTGLRWVASKIGGKKLVNFLEKTYGPPALWRLKGGMQASFIDIARTSIQELREIEEPTPANLLQYFNELQGKIEDAFTENIEVGEEEDDGVVHEYHEAVKKVSTISDNEMRVDLTEHLDRLQTAFTDLHEFDPDPKAVHDLTIKIEEVKAKMEQEPNPATKKAYTEELMKLDNMRRSMRKTPQNRKVRKENIVGKRDENGLPKEGPSFAWHRFNVMNLAAELEAKAKYVTDKEARQQMLYVVRECKTKVAKMELHKAGIIAKGSTGETFMDKIRHFKSLADVETLQAVFGHKRTEVANALTFQASSVPFLIPVFKWQLQFLPKNIKPIYVAALFAELNLFSSGADNLVAALVGLEVEPELWPYVMQASIDGGKNSRIGNMADLALCSMEDFELKTSVCRHLIRRRLSKAAANFGYAAAVDLGHGALSKIFPFLQLGGDEGSHHEATKRSPEEQKAFDQKALAEAIAMEKEMEKEMPPDVEQQTRKQLFTAFRKRERNTPDAPSADWVQKITEGLRMFRQQRWDSFTHAA